MASKPWTKADAKRLKAAQDRGADFATDKDVRLYQRSPQYRIEERVARKRLIDQMFRPIRRRKIMDRR